MSYRVDVSSRDITYRA